MYHVMENVLYALLVVKGKQLSHHKRGATQIYCNWKLSHTN